MERTLIDRLFSSRDLGLYAATTKMTMLVSLVNTAFQSAWGPFSLNRYKNKPINIANKTDNSDENLMESFSITLFLDPTAFPTVVSAV